MKSTIGCFVKVELIDFKIEIISVIPLKGAFPE